MLMLGKTEQINGLIQKNKCFNDYDFHYWAQNFEVSNFIICSISLNFGFNLTGTILAITTEKVTVMTYHT